MKNVVMLVTRCKMQQFLPGRCNFAWLLVGSSLVNRWLLVHEAFYDVSNSTRHRLTQK